MLHIEKVNRGQEDITYSVWGTIETLDDLHSVATILGRRVTYRMGEYPEVLMSFGFVGIDHRTPVRVKSVAYLIGGWADFINLPESSVQELAGRLQVEVATLPSTVGTRSDDDRPVDASRRDAQEAEAVLGRLAK